MWELVRVVAVIVVAALFFWKQLLRALMVRTGSRATNPQIAGHTNAVVSEADTEAGLMRSTEAKARNAQCGCNLLWAQQQTICRPDGENDLYITQVMCYKAVTGTGYFVIAWQQRIDNHSVVAI